MKNSNILFIAILASVFIWAPSNAEAQVNRLSIKNKKFERWMHEKNTVILDVRTPDEFSAERIPGAVNIDVKSDDFKAKIEKLDKNARYLIYCRSGKRSEKALHVMQQSGFINLYHLKRGINGWKGAREKSLQSN